MRLDRLPAVLLRLEGVAVLGASIALWLGHVGLDHALGYGLKYPTGFGNTHLQRV